MKAHYTCVSDCPPERENTELEAENFLKRYPHSKVKRTLKDGNIHIYIDTGKPPKWLKTGEKKTI